MALKFTGYIFCVLLVGVINVSEINSEHNDTTAKKDLNFSPLIHLDDEQIQNQNHDHHKVVPRVGVNQQAMHEIEKNIVKKIIDQQPPITTTVSPIKNQTTLAHSSREGVTTHANLNSTDKNVNKTGATISNTTKVSPTLNTTSATSLLSPSSTVATTSHTITLSNSTNVSKKENATATTTTATTTSTTTTSTKPSTATTKTTTTAPTTTTTPIPKKPTVTFSLEDLPQEISSPKKITHHSSEKLGVEEPEQPIAQPSQEINLNPNSSEHTDYIIPVVALMFAVPIIMGAIIVSYRRIRDYWSTRHYRRMDFLVDGMYND